MFRSRTSNLFTCLSTAMMLRPLDVFTPPSVLPDPSLTPASIWHTVQVRKCLGFERVFLGIEAILTCFHYTLMIGTSCDGVAADSLEWFKIQEDGFSGGVWASEAIAKTKKWNFKIPAELASG